MALLVLTPNAALDPVGVARGGGGFHGVRNRADPQVATSRASAHLYRGNWRPEDFCSFQ
ncbi:hypothetical protein ECZU34_64330 [Escherichia coli]|nr:hypothetical protein ECZU34_64330 [Escherichia coli]